jgi:CheY-like chemotaxis protein
MLSSQSLFRVLVLDDEPMVLALLGHLFVGMGCAVELVEGGGEALGYVRDQPWNLVVLDQQVPHVQGGDPVPRVQAAAESRGVPVWACTSLCNTLEWDALRAQGYRHILAKPVLPDAVRSGLRSFGLQATMN